MTKNHFQQVLTQTGVLAFVPYGTSMWPTLKGGKQSVVVLKKEQRLEKYQVAFFMRADGTYVLHTVLEVLDDGYTTCGDSLLKPEFVYEGQVIGVMSGYYRGTVFVDALCEKHIKKIVRWYEKKRTRKFKIKFFYFRLNVKNKLGKIFKKKKDN